MNAKMSIVLEEEIVQTEEMISFVGVMRTSLESCVNKVSHFDFNVFKYKFCLVNVRALLD